MALEQGFRGGDDLRSRFFPFFRSGQIAFEETIGKFDTGNLGWIDQVPDGKITGQKALFIQGIVDPLGNGRIGKQFVVHGILL